MSSNDDNSRNFFPPTISNDSESSNASKSGDMESPFSFSQFVKSEGHCEMNKYVRRHKDGYYSKPLAMRQINMINAFITENKSENNKNSFGSLNIISEYLQDLQNKHEEIIHQQDSEITKLIRSLAQKDYGKNHEKGILLDVKKCKETKLTHENEYEFDVQKYVLDANKIMSEWIAANAQNVNGEAQELQKHRENRIQQDRHRATLYRTKIMSYKIWNLEEDRKKLVELNADLEERNARLEQHVRQGGEGRTAGRYLRTKFSPTGGRIEPEMIDIEIRQKRSLPMDDNDQNEHPSKRRRLQLQIESKSIEPIQKCVDTRYAHLEYDESLDSIYTGASFGTECDEYCLELPKSESSDQSSNKDGSSEVKLQQLREELEIKEKERNEILARNLGTAELKSESTMRSATEPANHKPVSLLELLHSHESDSASFDWDNRPIISERTLMEKTRAWAEDVAKAMLEDE